MEGEKKAKLYMWTVVFIWGVSFLSIKTVVAVVPPMMQGLLRFSISSVGLFCFMIRDKSLFRLKKADLKWFALAGSVGITLYFYFENSSMLYLDASIASLLIASIPVFMVIAEAVIDHIPLSRNRIISVLGSIVGVYLIVGHINFKTSQNNALGLVLMFGAVLAWVIYAFSTRHLYQKYKPITINFYQTVIGTVCFLPFALFEETKWKFVDVSIVLNILFLGICCSTIAFLLYTVALGKLGASKSSIFLNAMPIVTVVTSYFVLGESINFSQAVGGIIVIGAVILCEKPTIKTTKEEITAKK